LEQAELLELDEYLHKLSFMLHLDNMSYYSKVFNGNSLLDFKLLRYIYEHDSCKLGDIKSYANIPSSTLTSVMKRFEKKKLIRRMVDPEDNRAFVINITDIGRKLHGEHRKTDLLLASKILENITEEESRKEFLRLLKMITQNPVSL